MPRSSRRLLVVRIRLAFFEDHAAEVLDHVGDQERALLGRGHEDQIGKDLRDLGGNEGEIGPLALQVRFVMSWISQCRQSDMWFRFLCSVTLAPGARRRTEKTLPVPRTSDVSAIGGRPPPDEAPPPSGSRSEFVLRLLPYHRRQPQPQRGP